jgi:hypothetical protein
LLFTLIPDDQLTRVPRKRGRVRPRGGNRTLTVTSARHQNNPAGVGGWGGGEGREERCGECLFLADYKGKTVVVEFCEKYSGDGHGNLASVGLAPVLHYASEVVGGLTMVVMDLVDGHDAYHEFRFKKVPKTVILYMTA